MLPCSAASILHRGHCQLLLLPSKPAMQPTDDSAEQPVDAFVTPPASSTSCTASSSASASASSSFSSLPDSPPTARRLRARAAPTAPTRGRGRPRKVVEPAPPPLPSSQQ